MDVGSDRCYTFFVSNTIAFGILRYFLFAFLRILKLHGNRSACNGFAGLVYAKLKIWGITCILNIIYRKVISGCDVCIRFYFQACPA